MIEEIKELRVKIDGLAQLTKSLKQEITVVDLSTIPHNQTVEEYLHNLKNGLSINQESRKIFIPSKEVLKTIDNLYLAKAWLGKLLGELGTESPYPKDGTRKTVKDIEPTADKQRFLRYEGDDFKTTIEEFEDKNHIEKVDWLRQEIERLSNNVKNIPTYRYEISELPNNTPVEWKSTREFSIARTNSYNYLCEARFQLGFELQRIKEEK